MILSLQVLRDTKNIAAGPLSTWDACKDAYFADGIGWHEKDCMKGSIRVHLAQCSRRRKH